MNDQPKPIEQFFLESLLKLCLIGISIVIVVDFYFTRLTLSVSLIVNSAVLTAILSAFLLYRFGYFKVAVITIGGIIMMAMFYQSIHADSITTSSMAVIMVVGFGFSVLLKGKLSITLHFITLSGMTTVFTWLALHPQQYNKSNANDIIVAGVTYGILYLVISYSSMLLKQRYDQLVKTLESKNIELIEKNNEIETQNEELIQSQENLHQLTIHLESLVDARTEEVRKKNEKLIKYAFSNAHHLRGPVARLLGLIQLTKLEAGADFNFIFQKIDEQAQEIDQVVKQINNELDF